jgi:hypothetical protein
MSIQRISGLHEYEIDDLRGKGSFLPVAVPDETDGVYKGNFKLGLDNLFEGILKEAKEYADDLDRTKISPVGDVILNRNIGEPSLLKNNPDFSFRNWQLICDKDGTIGYILGRNGDDYYYIPITTSEKFFLVLLEKLKEEIKEELAQIERELKELESEDSGIKEKINDILERIKDIEKEIESFEDKLSCSCEHGEHSSSMEEPPDDGQIYGRIHGKWVPLNVQTKYKITVEPADEGYAMPEEAYAGEIIALSLGEKPDSRVFGREDGEGRLTMEQRDNIIALEVHNG